MQRSVGIKVSAVVAIIGSVFWILIGLFIIMVALMSESPAIPAAGSSVSPAASAMSLARVSVLYMAGGIWGIVSAIGLLRLRYWARICVAIVGGLFAVFSLFVAIGLMLGISLMPQEFPSGSVVSSGFITGLLSVFAMIALLIAGLGIWWVFYLNRKHVKIQFLGEDTASAPRQLPVSIVIIAWVLIASGIMILPQLLAPTPTLIFSFIFHGSAARLIYFLTGSVSLVSGSGVLKKIPEAYSISMAFLCFSFANSLSSYLLPGSHTRRSNLIQELLGNQTVLFPMDSYLTFVILIGLVTTGAGLWLLMTRKQAFLHATAKWWVYKGLVRLEAFEFSLLMLYNRRSKIDISPSYPLCVCRNVPHAAFYQTHQLNPTLRELYPSDPLRRRVH